MTLTSYIEQGMSTTQIVDLIFDLHRDFISPKVIARRQVVRLIDRLLTKVAPDLLLNRTNQNKENQIDLQNGTPARPLQQTSDRDHPERKNLALQLNEVRNDPKSKQSSVAASGRAEPMLDQAPESERSEAFSMPVSEGDSSARQGFN